RQCPPARPPTKNCLNDLDLNSDSGEHSHETLTPPTWPEPQFPPRYSPTTQLAPRHYYLLRAARRLTDTRVSAEDEFGARARKPAAGAREEGQAGAPTAGRAGRVTAEPRRRATAPAADAALACC